MRVTVVKIMLILLATGIGTSGFCHVSLDDPVGGETFTAGEAVTIRWTELVAHNTLNWDLYFSSDGGVTWETIVLDIAYGTLSYEWTVPEISTSEGVVRVVQDNPGMNYEHQCLNFTIMVDSAPPAIDNSAQDTVISCSMADQPALIQNWLQNNGGASATSFCGNLNWTNDYSGLSDGCGSTGNASVIFTATDDCGNSSTTSAILTVSDGIAPLITNNAQDMTLECADSGMSGQISDWLDNQGGASASDACGSVEWTNDYSGLSDGCGNTGSAVVIFTATDACGNTSTTNAAITVEDKTAPVIETGAMDMIIDCNPADQQVDIQFWIASHGLAVANDNCGIVTWANDFAGISDDCGETGSAIVIFTATDECGNSSTTSAFLDVVDSDPPVIEKMADDISVECDDPDRDEIIQGWLNDNASASATDLCGSITWSNNYTEPTEDCMGETMVAVTFTSTDGCGNTASTIANIQNTVSTGIDGLSDLVNMNIFPIPSRDNIHVNIGSNGNSRKTLLLYGPEGSLLWKNSGASDTWDINVGNLTSGIYLLKVITKDGSLTRKVVVEH